MGGALRRLPCPPAPAMAVLSTPHWGRRQGWAIDFTAAGLPQAGRGLGYKTHREAPAPPRPSSHR